MNLSHIDRALDRYRLTDADRRAIAARQRRHGLAAIGDDVATAIAAPNEIADEIERQRAAGRRALDELRARRSR